MNPGKPLLRLFLASAPILALPSCSAILDSMVDSALDSAFDSDQDRSSGEPRVITHGKARSGVDHANTGSR